MAFTKQVTLKNISMNVKQNGVLLEMELDNEISQKNIAAWQSNSDWFYITLYQVTGDSAQLSETPKPQQIRKFQPVISQESLQLGFQLQHPIEHYDISPKENTTKLLASLHYPNELLASLTDQENLGAAIKEEGMRAGLRSWLYVTGFSLTLNGLLTQGQGKTNWETIAGLSTLLATFIADKLWTDS